jgi:RNA polymerase sigma factor (sigma-70 family)
MSTAAVRGVVRQLAMPDAPPTDAALVTRYARTRENAAFAELLRRHGPVVLGVCRRLLPNRHDAEDAFQAVFLVLARKADSVRPPGLVGSWLYGVAVRTASKARVAAARRWRREMASAMASPASPDREVGGGLDCTELRAVIDDELGRLAAPLRAAVVLCDLGGKTRAEAARELGCPEGTVAARLHRARKLLVDRLTRRGIALPAAGLGAALTPEVVTATVPPALARTTLAAAEVFATGAASPAIPPTVQTLAEGVVRAMNAGKVKLVLAAVAIAGLMAGAGALWGASGTSPGANQKEVSAATVPAAAGERAVPKRNDQPGLVSDIRFAPDGTRYCVVAGGRVAVFDAATGKRRWDATGQAAHFALDGRTLFVMGEKVQERDPVTGQVRKEHPRPKYKFLGAFAPDCKQYTTFDGGKFRLYDTATGTEPVQLDGNVGNARPAAGTTEAAFFSPDGKRVIGHPIAFLNNGNTVTGVGVWDTSTGRVTRIGAGTETPHVAAAISPDGQRLAVAFATHISMYDTAPFKWVRYFDDAAGPVTALAFSPDGKHLAAGIRKPVPNGTEKEPRVLGHKTEVQLLDVATGEEMKRFDGFEGVNHTAPTELPVTALAFSPDGKHLLAGTGILPGTTFPADGPLPKTGEVKTFALAATTPAKPATAPVPEKPAPAAWKHTNSLFPKKRVTALGVAADGTTFAAGTTDGEVVVADTATGKELVRFRPDPKTPRPIQAVALAPGGKLLAVAVDGRVRLHDPATGKAVDQPKIAPPAGDITPTFISTALAFSPDGKLLAVHSCGVGHSAPLTRLIDMATGEDTCERDWPAANRPGGGRPVVVPNSPSGRDGPMPSAVAFSPDGKRLAVSVNVRSMKAVPQTRVVEIKTGKLVAELDDLAAVSGLAWSPDGKRLVAGAPDGRVVAWDAATFKAAHSTRSVDGTFVTAVAFSPDGSTLAAAVMTCRTRNPDGTLAAAHAAEVRLYDAANLTERQRLPGPTADWLPVLTFAPDGKAILAGCGPVVWFPEPLPKTESGGVRVYRPGR